MLELLQYTVEMGMPCWSIPRMLNESEIFLQLLYHLQVVSRLFYINNMNMFEKHIENKNEIKALI